MRESIFIVSDGTLKKGKPAKKPDTGKKVPKKKAEAAKKPPKSKENEVYQPDQYYSSPPPVAMAGEQSVSRGLFIQTITEVNNFTFYCFPTAFIHSRILPLQNIHLMSSFRHAFPLVDFNPCYNVLCNPR